MHMQRPPRAAAQTALEYYQGSPQLEPPHSFSMVGTKVADPQADRKAAKLAAGEDKLVKKEKKEKKEKKRKAEEPSGEGRRTAPLRPCRISAPSRQAAPGGA